MRFRASTKGWKPGRALRARLCSILVVVLLAACSSGGNSGLPSPGVPPRQSAQQTYGSVSHPGAVRSLNASGSFLAVKHE